MSGNVSGGRSETHRYRKALLGLGYVGVIVAVAVAQLAPAEGYELSVYGATPTAVWVGLGVAMVAALATALSTTSGRVRLGAYLLAGIAVIAVAGLPLLRGYYFYGGGDSLSHLGWARQFAAGAASAPDLLHPGVHLVSLMLAGAADASLEWALVFAVVAYFGAYLVFVPLTVRTIVGDELAVVVGVFSAAMLVPINNVSAHPVAHPFTQAAMLFPFVLYVALNYLARPQGKRLSVSSVGALLSLSSVTVVLVHPQQALDVLLAFLGFVGIQYLARAYPGESRLDDHHPMHFQTLFLGAAFFGWSSGNSRFEGAVSSVIERLLYGAPVGDEVGQRSASLAQLGGSIEELFLKLFLVALVYGAVAGLFFLASFSGRLEWSRRFRESLLKYLALAAVPPTVLFFVFFAASATTQPFRYVAAAMVPVTIAGATGIGYWLAARRDRRSATAVAADPIEAADQPRVTDGRPRPNGGSTPDQGQGSLPGPGIRRSVQVTLVVALGIMLALSLLTVHPSPFIYKNSAQVTEERMDGYRTVFEVRDPTIAFAGIRGGPSRYVHAEYGPRSERSATFPGRRAAIPPAVFDRANYSTHYEGPRYLSIQDSDYAREVRLYEGLRYSRAGFEALETEPGIDKVYDSEGLDLYLAGNASAG